MKNRPHYFHFISKISECVSAALTTQSEKKGNSNSNRNHTSIYIEGGGDEIARMKEAEKRTVFSAHSKALCIKHCKRLTLFIEFQPLSCFLRLHTGRLIGNEHKSKLPHSTHAHISRFLFLLFAICLCTLFSFPFYSVFSNHFI